MTIYIMTLDDGTGPLLLGELTEEGFSYNSALLENGRSKMYEIKGLPLTDRLYTQKELGALYSIFFPLNALHPRRKRVADRVGYGGTDNFEFLSIIMLDEEKHDRWNWGYHDPDNTLFARSYLPRNIRMCPK